MGRIRTIKPEFPHSESMGKVSRDARLLFVQLWTLADDSGRARGASRMLASLLFPYDNDAPKLIDRWLAELEGQGCINRYTLSDGDTYIQVCNWSKHQKIDKPSASKIPPFDERSRIVDERSLEDRDLDQGPRIKDQGSISRVARASDSPPGFAEFWSAYNRKVAKPTAEKSWRRLAPDAELVAVIVRQAKAYAASVTDKQFQKHPATWLNGQGWNDEIVPRTEGRNGKDHIIPKVIPTGYYKNTDGTDADPVQSF